MAIYGKYIDIINEKVSSKFIWGPFVEQLNPKNWNSPIYDGSFEQARPRILKKINWCKSMDDINYLRRDSSWGDRSLNKLKEDLDYALKNPDDKKSKYVELRKRNKKGLTVEKIDKHLKWCKEVYNVALNEKAKEIREKSKSK